MRLSKAFPVAQVASAAVITRQYAPCSFKLNVVGTPAGFVQESQAGQLSVATDGGQFYMIGHALYDSSNRNCNIGTDSSLVCSSTSTPSNFTVSDYGNLVHGNTEAFLACPTDGTYSIYGSTKSSTTDCNTITLRTGGYNCTANGHPDPSSTSTAQTATSTPTSISTSTKNTSSCPTDLSQPFISPHSYIPVSSKSPNSSFGPSSIVYISPLNTTLYTFSLPASTTNKSYSLLFLFPYKSELYNSSNVFLFSGSEQEVGGNGGINFSLLSSAPLNSTTYASTPSVSKDFGKTQVFPGFNYTVGNFSYAGAGGDISVKAESVGDLELDYGQDSRPLAMGLYVVGCE